MTFNLLGPLEIRCRGRVVPAPAGRVRTLLVMFVLAPDRAVARGPATTELWGEFAPRSAPANLRSYMSTLRLWMCRYADGSRVSRHEHGWSSTIDGDVDIFGFEADLDLARAAVAGHDLPAARAALRSAVFRYRGTPMLDIPQGSALASRSQVLVARWMTAVEHYAVVLLELGEYDTARHLLHEFLGQQPFRERAWAQLMVACSRSGDVAAALDAYRQARRSLADGLGVEPSAELTNLHQAILRGDPQVRLSNAAFDSRLAGAG